MIFAVRGAALVAAGLARGPARKAALGLHNFLWLYPTLRRNCQWHGPVATRFETPEREVWLTIDDGPYRRDTPELLDVLAEHGAKATFFVVGKQVDKHRELCRRIVTEGHTLGNHTYTHPSGAWWMMPRPLIEQEIRNTSHAIRVATGTSTEIFRSPVGMNNIHSIAAAQRQGMSHVIGWSASGNDGCPSPTSHIVENIMNDARPGAILLLHEGGWSRRRAATLDRLLNELSAQGYRCVLPALSDLR